MMPLSKLRSKVLAFAAAAALALPALAIAQDPGRPLEKKLGPADIIMPHITDSKTIEFPCIHGWTEWACDYTFARHDVTIGSHT